MANTSSAPCDPHLAWAIILSSARPAASAQLVAAATGAPTLAAAALTIIVLLLGLVFLIVMTRAIRELAELLAQLIGSALTIGSAIFAIAAVGVAIIALLFHH